MITIGRTKCPFERGFSFLELLVVCLILIVMIGVALFSLPAARRAQAVDDATGQLVDVMRYAQQRSLAERQVMRVELVPGTDDEPGSVSIVDEGTISEGTADDALVRSETLADVATVEVNTAPTAFPLPPAPHNFEAAPFVEGRLTLLFNPDGAVTNVADTPQSLSLVLFTPAGDGRPDPALIRSITLFGPTASVDVWRWNPATNAFEEE